VDGEGLCGTLTCPAEALSTWPWVLCGRGDRGTAPISGPGWRAGKRSLLRHKLSRFTRPGRQDSWADAISGETGSGQLGIAQKPGLLPVITFASEGDSGSCGCWRPKVRDLGDIVIDGETKLPCGRDILVCAGRRRRRSSARYYLLYIMFIIGV
jgi:hypothetical protein